MRSRIIAVARAVIITSGLTFTGQSAAQGFAVDPAHPVITTSGSGGVHIPPDGASVIIAVESRAATASAAAALNATATTSTLASLRAAGLTASQLSTTGFSVGVDYRRGTVTSAVQPPVTFVATNGVRADIHVLATLSKVIDAALAGGATQVSGLQFTSTGMEQARRAALAQAVESARSDADAIARAAGGSLGALVEVTSGDNMVFSGKSVQMQIGGVEAMAPPPPPTPPPTPLTPRDVPVNANVTARWIFVPGH